MQVVSIVFKNGESLKSRYQLGEVHSNVIEVPFSGEADIKKNVTS